MKKFVCMAVMLCILCTVLVLPAAAEGGTASFQVIASASTANVGDNVTVYVRSSFTAKAWQVRLIFNSDVLECTGATKLGGSNATVKNSEGKVSATGVYMDSGDTAYSGDFIVATFKVKKAGDVSFTLDSSYTKVATAASENITGNLGSASLHIHKGTAVAAKAPTCEEPGNIAHYKCSCGKVYSDENCTTALDKVTIDATGHNWGDWEQTKPATCTEDNVMTRICGNDASHKETKSTVPAKGHKFTTYTQTTAPTCTADGVKTATCDNGCGTTDKKAIPAKGHSTETVWTPVDGTNTHKGSCPDCGVSNVTEDHKWVETAKVDATCTTAGYKDSKCSVCNATKHEVLDIVSTAHSWGKWTETKAATCTEANVMTRTCTHNSAHKETDSTIAALGHTWEGSTWVKVDANNHKAVCSRCNDETVAAAVKTEKHNYVKDTSKTDVPATCKATGTKYLKCSGCGDEKTETVAIDPTAHKWGDWEETKAATCTEANEKTRTCEHDSNHTETKSDVAALGHSFTVWKVKDITADTKFQNTDSKQYKHVSKCDRCTETKEETHSGRTSKAKTPATCVATGVESFECPTCKATWNVELPIDTKDGHKWVNFTDLGNGMHQADCDHAGCPKGQDKFEHKINQPGVKNVDYKVVSTDTTKKTETRDYLCKEPGCTGTVRKTVSTNTDKSHSTGDITGQVVMTGVASVSVLAAAAYVLKRKFVK